MAIEDRDGAWEVYSQLHTQHHTAFQHAMKQTDALSGTRRLLQNDDDFEHDGLAENSASQVSSRSLPTHKSPSWTNMHQPLRRLAQEDGKGSAAWYLFYKTNKEGTGNIFTANGLQKMCELEKVAMTSHSGTLDYISSPVVVAYDFDEKAPETWKCTSLPQATIDAFVKNVSDDIGNQKTQSKYAGFVHPSFVTTGVTAYTRTTISVKKGKDKAWSKAILAKLGASYGYMRSAYQGLQEKPLEIVPLSIPRKTII